VCILVYIIYANKLRSSFLSNTFKNEKFLALKEQVMTAAKPGPGEGVHLNSRQVAYARYLPFILIDMVVINLFVEYWDRIVIDSFTITLFTACVMQLLLKLTIALEHRTASCSCS